MNNSSQNDIQYNIERNAQYIVNQSMCIQPGRLYFILYMIFRQKIIMTLRPSLNEMSILVLTMKAGDWNLIVDCIRPLYFCKIITRTIALIIELITQNKSHMNKMKEKFHFYFLNSNLQYNKLELSQPIEYCICSKIYLLQNIIK